MTPPVRKLVAIVLGFLTTIICYVFGFFICYGFTATIADNLSNKKTQKIFGDNWYFDKPEFANFYFFYEILLAVAIGLMVTYIILDFKDRFRKRLFIYIPFMVIILGFTEYNYAHADLLIQPDIQAPLNLILIFLALVCLVRLWKLQTQSTDGQILKYFVFFLLFLFGFCLPAFFSVCWLIDKLGISQLNFNFNMPIITTISGMVTAVITILKYRDDRKKEKNIITSK